MAKAKSGKKNSISKKSLNSTSLEQSNEGSRKFSFTTERKKALLPLAVFLVLYGFIWLTPETAVIQPWSEAILLVDSADKIKDPILRETVRDKGGKTLKELLDKYPFHARIHYFYGHYLLKSGNWDSSIFYLNNAIRMDSGSESNTIWTSAREEIVFPYFKKYEKLLQENKNELALHQLLEAHQINRTRADLNLMLANIYKQKNDFDSALIFYKWYRYKKPDDINVLNNIGIISLIKKDTAEAQRIFEKILTIDPAYENAKKNLIIIANMKKNKK